MTMTPAPFIAPARIDDPRIWQFRQCEAQPCETLPRLTEKRLFASRAAIPEGEGWFNSRPEAEAGKIAEPLTSASLPFEQLSVAEQVARLEAAGKALDAQEVPDDDVADNAVLSEADAVATTPAKRGRKAKAV